MKKYEVVGRLQLGILLLSLGLVIAHSLGVFKISKDLLSAGDIRYSMSTQGVEGGYKLDKGVVQAHCIFKQDDGHRYCNLLLYITNSAHNGLDLSSYDSIDLGFDLSGPDPNRNIVLHLWNFNPLFSKEGVDTSLKFNIMKFFPSSSGNVHLSLQNLYVPSWWLESNKLTHEAANVELDNVAAIQFALDDKVSIGEYKMRVSSIVLSGHAVSIYQILILMGGLFVLASLWAQWLQHQYKQTLLHHDVLTGQLNRHGLGAWIGRKIEGINTGSSAINSKQENSKQENSTQTSSTHADKQLLVFYIDLDDFKKVNDTYGHRTGDQLLSAICKRMNDYLVDISQAPHLNLSGVFARLSGDEFSLAIDGLSSLLLDEFSQNLLRHFTKAYDLESLQVKINASIGLAIYNNDELNKNLIEQEVNAETLLHQADIAMYHSKHSGKNQYQIFNQELEQKIAFRKRVSVGVKEAIGNEEFEIVFMPIYRCDTGKIAGAELLLRAQNDTLKGVGPDVFIPISEEYGYIKEIDLWVIERAFQRMSDFPDLFARLNIRFSINLSSVELHNGEFIPSLEALLEQYNIDADTIEFEITETNLTNVDDQSINFLKSLQGLGFSLALDDFGTGYTGFNQLLYYPVNVVKIDRSFITRINKGGYFDTTMVDAILSIARSYDLEVVAEGVETLEQLDYLKENGCHLVQGYYLSKALSWEGFLQALNVVPSVDGSKDTKESKPETLSAKIKSLYSA